MSKKVQKKVKIRYKNVLFFVVVIIAISFLTYKIIKMPISNIYISGNSILTDEEIIRIAKIENYPSTISNLSSDIKKRLEDSPKINSAKVTKKDLSKVYIEVVENRPLFYNSNTNKVVMLDKTEQESDEITPYLLNYIPDTIYDKFIDAMANVNTEVLKRISEIEYNPNEVDKERFYLTMNDGNKVYLTLSTYDKINNYISMIKQFNNKKGTLYLDSGEYFKVN